MRLVVAAIGRLKAGPERDLTARYQDRLAAFGRGVALGPIDMIEIDESRARRPEDRKAEEAAALLAQTQGATLIVLDETGRTETSEAFSARLAKWRDAGTPAVALLIGGPDGHGDAVRQAASLVLSFGAMTFPHQLVRALALEQLYRAATIIAGHPYHRG